MSLRALLIFILSSQDGVNKLAFTRQDVDGIIGQFN